MFTIEGNTVHFFLKSFAEGAGFNVYVAIVFFLLWFFFCAIEYGIAVPAGLFFPGLLIGASLGQFVGLFLFEVGIISDAKMLSAINVYATIGGVSVLTGYTRLSFCLAVLFMETTQNVNLFIPMLLGILFSRGVGNLIVLTKFFEA